MAETGEATESRIRHRDIDPDALKVVRKLLGAGHEAYLVGGCVRDLYVELKPKDFDVATSATPEQIHRLFRNSRIIGRRFKLVHVYYGQKNIETSTFRTAPRQAQSGDADETGDGDADLLITHDNEWGSIEDDARRRDFTVNGLFYDIQDRNIVDFVDGLNDLDAGVIRTIGVPAVRFQEDPVRMIRAIKFAARLDFKIEDETWQALLDNVEEIVKCSRARVLEELYKLLRGGAAARSFELMAETGLLDHIWPEYLELFGGSDALLAERELASQQTPDPDADPEAVPPAAPGASLVAHLQALDAYVSETGQVATNGVLQSILYAPLLGDDLDTAPRRELDQKIDQLMHRPSVALGVARRDRELARQILVAHRRMANPNRRGRRSSIVHRQYFHDALVFLGISVEARGRDGGHLQHWQALAATRVTSDDEPTGSNRRRRRRGRRSSRKKRPRSGGGGGDDKSANREAGPA